MTDEELKRYIRDEVAGHYKGANMASDENQSVGYSEGVMTIISTAMERSVHKEERLQAERELWESIADKMSTWTLVWALLLGFIAVWSVKERIMGGGDPFEGFLMLAVFLFLFRGVIPFFPVLLAKKRFERSFGNKRMMNDDGLKAYVDVEVREAFLGVPVLREGSEQAVEVLASIQNNDSAEKE